MHVNILTRLLPLLAIGTQLISADRGLSMRRAGRHGASGNNVRSYDQCVEHCDKNFVGGNAAAVDPATAINMAIPTDASSTRTRRHRPTACKHKPGKTSGTATISGTASVSEGSAADPVQTNDVEPPVTDETAPASAQISSATQFTVPTETAAADSTVTSTTTKTETVEEVAPSTTQQIAPSTSQNAEEQPVASSSVQLDASPSNVGATSASAPEPQATQAAVAGALLVDRSNSEDWVKAHNDERAKYGAEPITWNTEMASVAEAWGANCVWEHSKGKYGENIAASIAADTDPVRTATGLWIGEAKDYDYDNPQGAHWTQMVWKGLGEIGCAAVNCPAETAEDKKTIWTLMVCEYQLKAGATGSFAENVGRPV